MGVTTARTTMVAIVAMVVMMATIAHTTTVDIIAHTIMAITAAIIDPIAIITVGEPQPEELEHHAGLRDLRGESELGGKVEANW